MNWISQNNCIYFKSQIDFLLRYLHFKYIQIRNLLPTDGKLAEIVSSHCNKLHAQNIPTI